MAPRRTSKPDPRRTPVLEWASAALGLAATLGVLGYSVWEGVTHRSGPPELVVEGKPAEHTGAGFVVPLTVRNESHTTAAAVEVRASLEKDGRVIEERRATFTYVPGRGEATGGVVFRTDPAIAQLRLEAEGYQNP